MNPTPDKITRARKLVRRSFRVMSMRKLDDTVRERKLRRIRRRVDHYPAWVITSAAQRELRENTKGYVYMLFLQNILLAGRL